MPFDSNNPRRDRRRAIGQPFLFLFAVVSCFSGCATPRQTYLQQHPDLTADHRKIIAAGRLVDRDPVAGMTRQEIRLTMGADPTQALTINGEDAWVWVKKRLDGSMTLMDDSSHSGSTGAGSFSGLSHNDDSEPKKKPAVRTTVFFRGDLATRVDVTEEPAETN